MAVRLAPLQGRPDALTELSRHFGVGGPDRLQDAQDILPSDAIDAHVADDGERPLLHALHPVLRGLAVAPAREIGFERRFGCLAERGYPRPSFLRQRVATIGNRQSILDGAFSSVRE